MSDPSTSTDEQDPVPAEEHVHEFGPARVVTAGTGDRVIVSDCRHCNAGTVVLERAPDMTVHWLLEHLEGVVGGEP